MQLSDPTSPVFQMTDTYPYAHTRFCNCLSDPVSRFRHRPWLHAVLECGNVLCPWLFLPFADVHVRGLDSNRSSVIC